MYGIKLVSSDLNNERNIRDILECLEQLCQVSEDIFNRIIQRIEEFKIRLNEIKERINVAERKVEMLNVSRNATKIISSVRYPAFSHFKHYVSLFNEKSVIPPKLNYELKCESPQCVEKCYKEKMNFFLLNPVSSQTKEIKPSGLGNIPLKISQIGSLLLSNTSKNIYKEYSFTDPFKVEVSNTALSNGNSDYKNMDNASICLLQKNLSDFTEESYFYNPTMGEVPKLDLPKVLPNLPRIASDFSFGEEANYQTEMSIGAVKASNLISCGSNAIKDLSNVSDHSSQTSVLSEMNSYTPPSVISSSSEIPNSETEVNFKYENILPTTSSASTASLVFSNEAHSTLCSIPPPPPLPKLVTCFDSNSSENNLSSVPAIKVGHSELFESIRQAAGKPKARVRKSSHGTEAASQKKSVSTSSANLMEELFSKLTLRRKGISGSNNTEKNKIAEFSTERIESMIPPLPSTDSISEPDDEWN